MTELIIGVILLILSGLGFISYTQPKISLKILNFTIGIGSILFLIYNSYLTGLNYGLAESKTISKDSVVSNNILDTIKDEKKIVSLKLVDTGRKEVAKEITDKIQKRYDEIDGLWKNSWLIYFISIVVLFVFFLLSQTFINKNTSP